MPQMNSIVFYRSFFEALQVFSDPSERAFMYDTVLEYAFNGTEPIELTPIQNAIFTLVKPQLDANVKKSESGKRGGRPKKETTETNGSENEKPLVSEKKTIGFKNKNHRFLETESNKNKKSNKNSEYEYVSCNENKNSNSEADNIPTTDLITDFLISECYLTPGEAKEISESFIDYNSSRNWSSLKTRTWQSLLKQFIRNDRRFTDDELASRKAKAEKKAEAERQKQEEAEQYWQGDTLFQNGQEFVEYIKGMKWTPYDADRAHTLWFLSEFGYGCFTADDLAEMFDSGIVRVDMQVGITELFSEPDVKACQNDALVAKIRKNQDNGKPQPTEEPDSEPFPYTEQEPEDISAIIG